MIRNGIHAVYKMRGRLFTLAGLRFRLKPIYPLHVFRSINATASYMRLRRLVFSTVSFMEAKLKSLRADLPLFLSLFYPHKFSTEHLRMR